MDIVSVPTETAFLKQAHSHEAKIIKGSRMLLHQAAVQVELFTGMPAPLSVMEQSLADALELAKNK
jgi:shikimate dehydrogenase